MPSSSKKQHSFMLAVAHSPEFARKVGVPQGVGRDFSNADKAAGKYKPKPTEATMAAKKKEKKKK